MLVQVPFTSFYLAAYNVRGELWQFKGAADHNADGPMFSPQNHKTILRKK